MNALLFYLYVYIAGGITFIPLVILTLLVFLNWYLPVYDDQSEKSSFTEDTRSELDEFGVTHPEIRYEDLKAGELDERLSSGVETYATGWLTVTTEFYQLSQYQPPKDGGGGTNGSSNDDSSSSVQEDEKALPQPPQNASPSSKIGSRYSQIYKFVKGDKNGSKETGEAETKNLKNVRKKNRYFAVLKHGNLFLYKDDDCKNVQHVIVLHNSVVTLWPRHLNEGALFGKRTAICIMKKAEPVDDTKVSPLEILKRDTVDQETLPPKGSFFIYSDYNHEKEDWYFNFIKATKRTYLKKDNDQDLLEPSIYATTSFFKTKHMIELIQTLNSSEGQLTTKWMNALIGRIFLALHNTQEFHDFVRSKVDKQLTKIKKPGFLDDFQIQKISVGDGGPFITFPKLRSLSPEGDLEIEANLLYQGGLSIQILTKANINLGSRFKSREVNLVLTVKLVKLAGQILIKVKPPPSNRIWYGFTSMPDLDLEIEPIVSARQLTYNVVTKMIGNKFKEAIRDSLVLPYMDEFPFYDTRGEIFRGGIWDKNVRSSNTRTDKAEHKETPLNDHSLNDYEDDEEEMLNSASDEYGKPQKSTTVQLPVSPPDAENASSMKHSVSFSSGFSSRSLSAYSTNKLGEASPETQEAVSLNSTTSQPEDPAIVPREEIPDAVEQSNPTQTHQTQAVYSDDTAAEPSSDQSSRMSKQMKKVFKHRNGSSDSVNSSSNSTDLLPSPQISSSLKKIGKWYNNRIKDNNGKLVEAVPDEISTKERNYNPPEMIRYRREKSLSQNSTGSPSQDQTAPSTISTSSSAMFLKKPSTEEFTALPKSPVERQLKPRKAPPPPSLPPREPPPPTTTVVPPSLPPRNNTAILDEIHDAILETRPGMILHRRSKSVLTGNSSIDETHNEVDDVMS